MGYTHYWEKNNVVSPKVWSEFTRRFRRLCELTANKGIHFTIETLDEDELHIEGGHESFYVDREATQGFQFCKTAEKPYDLLVVAGLYLMDELDIIPEWSSDGDEQDHSHGRALYKQEPSMIGDKELAKEAG